MAYKKWTRSGDQLRNDPKCDSRLAAKFVNCMMWSGKKSVAQLLSEAASAVPFMSMTELSTRLASRQNDLVVLDVREKDAYDAGHLPGAMFLPRGQLELRVNEAFPDPTVRIVVICEFGKISTLAAATLRSLGFTHAAALDGGMKAWREAGFAVET